MGLQNYIMMGGCDGIHGAKDPVARPKPNIVLKQAPINLPGDVPYYNLDFFRRSPENQKRYQKYLQYKGIEKLLNSVGIFMPVSAYAAAQVLHETGGQQNIDNNYSGIIFVGQRGATRGRPLPRAEQTGKITNYAHYDTAKQWAEDFKSIISKNNGAGAPIDVKDAGPRGYLEYVHRLWKNGYFPANGLKRYQNGMYNQINQIQSLLDWVHRNTDQIKAATIKDNQYYPATKDFKQNEAAFDAKPDPGKGLAWWQWGLIIVGGGIALKSILNAAGRD